MLAPHHTVLGLASKHFQLFTRIFPNSYTAAELSQAITQYAIGEGLFGDMVALDQAFLLGGKVTVENAGEWSSKTLLGKYLKQLGVEREGRQSVTIDFGPSGEMHRKALIEKAAKKYQILLESKGDVSGGSTMDSFEKNLAKIHQEMKEEMREARIRALERSLQGLLVVKGALQNRHADMSISQLRYEMEFFEVSKRIALTKMELEAPDSLEVIALLFSKKEKALQQRLFAIHKDWLEKYETRERLIQWDEVHLARLDNFAQAVQKSLPQNPEEQHLLGLYLLHRENNPKQEDSAPKQDFPNSSPPLVAELLQ